MSVVVRPAGPADYDAVGELTATAYRIDGFVTGGPYLEMLRDAAGRAAVTEVVVAVDGDELLGTVTLVSPEAPEGWRENYRDKAGTIRMLAVAKPARGRGVGAALTRWCIEQARGRGWRELVLVTQPDMHAAHRIYEQLGFGRDESLDFDVEDGLRLLGYSLSLT